MTPLSYVTHTSCISIWCCALGKHLVSTFARFCDVWTFINVIRPSSSTSQMKWYRTSICFVRAWNIAFFAKQMALWLSQPRTVPFQANQTHCIDVLTILLPWKPRWLRYSASAVDEATTFCSLVRHDTTPPASVNMYPLVDFRASTSLAMSESQKSFSSNGSYWCKCLVNEYLERHHMHKYHQLKK